MSLSQTLKIAADALDFADVKSLARSRAGCVRGDVNYLAVTFESPPLGCRIHRHKMQIFTVQN